MQPTQRQPSHSSLKIPARVALFLMTLRLALFVFGADIPGQEEIYVFLLLAALPALAIYAIRPRVSTAHHSVATNTVAALRSTLVYSLLMVGFLYLYFTFADKDFFPNFQDRAIALEREMNTELSDEEIVRRGKEFFSKRNFMVLTLGAMVLMSVFYSFLFSVLKKVVIRPGKSR